MFKFLLVFLVFIVNCYAIDFEVLKENIMIYIDSLDHPNKEIGNKFSKNLAITGEAYNTHITIYSVGFAMVSEEKNVHIEKPGNVKIMYSDVPSAVDLSSISMVFDKNVTLYSQKYAYDVVNFASLLKRHIGKYVLYINSQKDKEQKKATLLATDPIIVQDIKSENIFAPFKVFFENIPEDMAVTPTLFWDIKTEAKELGIRLEYLTDKITWRSDYNLYLKENKVFDLNSWITISNNSGASYTDANITIVTGTVKKIQTKESNKTLEMEKTVLETTNVTEKSANEYSLYPVPHIKELKNKEEKQISFIHGDKIKYHVYLFNDKTYDLSDSNTSTIHFSKVLAFENTKANQLGSALPQGKVRIYKYNTLSSKRFLGSTTVNNIKENETVELSMGETSDVIGEERVTFATQDAFKKHIIYVIKLKNSSNRNVHVKLKRTLTDKVGEVHIEDSCKEQCKKEKINNLSYLYNIQLKTNQIYEFEIRYLINTKANIKKGNI